MDSSAQALMIWLAVVLAIVVAVRLWKPQRPSGDSRLGSTRASDGAAPEVPAAEPSAFPPGIRKHLTRWAVGLLVGPLVFAAFIGTCSNAGGWSALLLWGMWALYSIYVAARVSWSMLSPAHGCLFSLASVVVAFAMGALGVAWLLIWGFVGVGCVGG